MKKIMIVVLLFTVASCSGPDTGGTAGEKRGEQITKEDSGKRAGIPWGDEKDGFSCRTILLDYALIEKKKLLKIECEVQVCNNSTNNKTIIIYPEKGMCMDLPFGFQIKRKEGWANFDASIVSTNTTSKVTLRSGETVSTTLKVEGSWENKEPGAYSFRVGCGQKGYGFGPLWSNMITLDIPAKGKKWQATLVLFGYSESSTVSVPLTDAAKWEKLLFKKEIGETPEWESAGKIVFTKGDKSTEALLDPQYYVAQKILPKGAQQGFVCSPKIGEMLMTRILEMIDANSPDSKEAITGGRFIVYYFMYNRNGREKALRGVQILKKALEQEGLTEEKRKEITHMIELFEFNESKR